MALASAVVAGIVGGTVAGAVGGQQNSMVLHINSTFGNKSMFVDGSHGTWSYTGSTKYDTGIDTLDVIRYDNKYYEHIGIEDGWHIFVNGGQKIKLKKKREFKYNDYNTTTEFYIEFTGSSMCCIS